MLATEFRFTCDVYSRRIIATGLPGIQPRVRLQHVIHQRRLTARLNSLESVEKAVVVNRRLIYVVCAQQVIRAPPDVGYMLSTVFFATSRWMLNDHWCVCGVFRLGSITELEPSAVSCRLRQFARLLCRRAERPAGWQAAARLAEVG